MKKAKIILVMTAILSVAAGALAYKASCPNFLYRDGFDGSCTLRIATRYSIVPTNYTGAPTYSTHLSSASSNGICNTVVIECMF